MRCFGARLRMRAGLIAALGACGMVGDTMAVPNPVVGNVEELSFRIVDSWGEPLSGIPATYKVREYETTGTLASDNDGIVTFLIPDNNFNANSRIVDVTIGLVTAPGGVPVELARDHTWIWMLDYAFGAICDIVECETDPCPQSAVLEYCPE